MAEAPLGGRPRSGVLAMAGISGTGCQEGMGRMVRRELRRIVAPATAGAGAVVLAFSLFTGQIGAQLEPVASPVASPQMGDCTPGAGNTTGSTGEGTPVPASAADATPVATDVADAVIAATDNVVNCLNAADVDSLSTLVTANLVQDKFGDALPNDLLPVTVLGYGDVSSYSDSRVGVQLQYLAGDYQYVTATWVYVDMDGEYLLDEEVLQTSQPDGDSVVKGFTIEEGVAISFPQGGTTAQMEAVILQGNNTATDQHVVELYSLGGLDTATPVADEAGVVESTEVPADATLVGSLSLAGGEQGDIALVNPAVGNYILVDTTDGSIANFSVTEPVEIEI